MTSPVLPGAFASLTRDNNGIALYCSADALRRLADIMRVGTRLDIDLPAPPEDVVESAPLRAIRVYPLDRHPIEVCVAGDAIEITGGTGELSMLAETFESLADTPAFGGEVLRHVDLQYFPGHGFLGRRSMWVTVILLPVIEST